MIMTSPVLTVQTDSTLSIFLCINANPGKFHLNSRLGKLLFNIPHHTFNF